MLSKKNKIILYATAAVAAVAAAILTAVLLISIISKQNNSDLSSAAISDFVSQPLPQEEIEVTIPEATIVVPEDDDIQEQEPIEEIIKETETIKPTKENTVVVKHNEVNTSVLSKKSVKIPLKYVPQNPELPTGCEITSLTAVLNYYGYDVSKTTMSDKYLEKTIDKIGNFWEVFVGNPRTNGFGCYAKPIVNAANKYLSSHGNRHQAVNLSGAAF